MLATRREVLPVLPRLLHQALLNGVSPAPTDEIAQMRGELARLRRALFVTVVLLAALGGYVLALA